MHPSSLPIRKKPVQARRMAAIVAAAALLACLSVPDGASASGASADSNSPVSVAALKTTEVEGLLAGVPLKDLSATQVAETLTALPGLSELPEGARKEALIKAIEGLAAKEGTLGDLAGSQALVSELESKLKGLLLPTELLSLLKSKTLESTLDEALDSVSPRQVLATVLSSAGEPQRTIEQVMAAPSPEKLETLLGGALTHEPFTTSTVGALASEAGTSVEGLAEDFGTTSAQLPASTMALTAPLTDGKTLGVLDAVKGIDLGTLGGTPEGSGGGAEGGKGGSGSGSEGGTGGPGGSSGGGAGGSGGSGSTGQGTPTSMTIVLDELAAQNPASPSASAKVTSAKVKILSHKDKGGVATLVVEVPAAGSLKISGKDVTSVSRKAAGAERLTLHITLTRAGASLRRRHHDLKVELTATFTAVGGSRSSATTTVSFA
jgi:hypothetical protein